MKKILLLSMALAAVSCSKSKLCITPVDGPVPILLNTGENMDFTRAPLNGQSTFDAQVIASTISFNSYANDISHLYSDHNHNAFDKVVTFTAGVGQISGPVVYYPKNYDNSIYFKGFVPSDGRSSHVTRSNSTVEFESIGGHTDIMVSPQVSGNRHTTEPLQLNFTHLLSQVIFKIKADSEEAVQSWGKITGIKVLNQYRDYELNLRTNELNHLVPFPDDLPRNLCDFVAYDDAEGQTLVVGEAKPLLSGGRDKADNNGILMLEPTSEAWEIEITSTNESEPRRFVLDPSVNELFTLEKGKASEITLNFKPHLVGISAQVTDWIEGNKTSVDLI